jgi:hypothetical protein
MRESYRNVLMIFRDTDKLFFINDRLKNKIDYVDDELDVKINNIISVKKEVSMYQWNEGKKLNRNGNFVHSYKKIWSSHYINSDNFYDKNKKNINNLKKYKSVVIVPNKLFMMRHGYTLDVKYFKDKIKYKIYDFGGINRVFEGAPVEKEYGFKYEDKGNDYSDPDSYVALVEKSPAIKERERFRLYNNVLYNGKNIKNPEIGDIKITYKIFSPTFISFFGNIINKELVPYNNEAIFDFDIGKDEKDLMLKYKMIIIAELVIYINIVFFLLDRILFYFRNQLKGFALSCIPYFNEYFAFANENKINTFLVFMIFLGVVIGSIPIILFLFFLLVILRNIDYYSV